MIRYFDSTQQQIVETIQQLRTTAYQRASSLLISLLILLGCGVLVMLVLWLTVPERGGQILIFPRPGGDENPSDAAAGVADFETPADDEMTEMTEQELTDVLSRIAAAAEGVSELDGRGTLGDGHDLPGDPRPPGEPTLPRPRWDLQIVTQDLNEYARRLDYFDIELGVAGGPPQIDYAADFTRPQPRVWQGNPRDEKRLYMTWRGGTVEQFDRRLLERAGIATRSRVILHFYPAELEQRLTRLERQYAGTQPAEEIRRTVFAVRSTENGYEIYVVEQYYR